MVSMLLWYPLSVDVMLQALANGYLATLIGRGYFVFSAFAFGFYWIARTGCAIVMVEAGMGPLGAALALPIASICQLFLCCLKDQLRIVHCPGVSWRSIRGSVGHYGLSIGLERFLLSMDLVVMKFMGADARALGFYAAATNLSYAFQSIAGGIDFGLPSKPVAIV